MVSVSGGCGRVLIQIGNGEESKINRFFQDSGDGFTNADGTKPTGRKIIEGVVDGC